MTHYLHATPNGQFQIDEFQASGYELVTVRQAHDESVDYALKNEVEGSSSKYLEANLTAWIVEECKKVDISFMETKEEAENYVFGEADFLEDMMNALGVDVGDCPELRDFQHQIIESKFS